MESPTPEEQTARARLFVALALPEAAREAIARWSKANLAADRRLRIVDADALHVTLAFLGRRALSTVESIADAALTPAASRRRPLLSPTEAAGLPVRRPRVVALDLSDEDGRAAIVQAAVVEGLAAAGLFTPEHRPFRPHLTVARVRGRSNVELAPVPVPPSEPFEACEVVLFRSDLRSDGARYTSLARVDLPSQGP